MLSPVHVLTVECKLQVMNSYIASHFKFCSLMWHFCSTSDTRKWKMYNTGHLNTYNDFKMTYCDLRARSHIQLLYIQRQRAILE